MKIFVSAPRGTIRLLKQECRDCGATGVKSVAGGVECEVTREALYRLCLWSRVANRVLLPIESVKADTTDALYAGTRQIEWDKIFPVSKRFAVDCNLVQADIEHSHFAALRVKDAIVDFFRDKYDERPSVDTVHSDIRINVYIKRKRAQIALDMSGGSLHRRGYREAGGEAPLKENLAAALLMFAGWPKQQALFDPMCGSGTLLIEAALMAADIAPGLQRERFGFQACCDFDAGLWQSLLDEAHSRREKGLASLGPIRGHDADKKAVRTAIANISRAGLQAYIHAETRALAETGSLPAALCEAETGLLITNPPYGERISSQGSLRELHAGLGELLRQQLPKWQAAVFTGNPDMVLYQGAIAREAIDLFNGPLECRLFIYDAEVKQNHEGAVMFANRLRKNLKKFRRWAGREGIDCYRVYDADLPEYAVAIDLYHGEQRFVYVQEYAAPSSIDPDLAMQRLQAVFSVLSEVLEVPASNIWFRQRRRQQGSAQYTRVSESHSFHEVHDGPCRLWVNFDDYLDTGLFLDHRITRNMLGQQARGKRFLNLFCYTATATVHAALGGASETCSVDMSKTYLDWARRNFVLNGMDMDKHELVRANCVEWLEQAGADKQRQYDLIFMDPPTFSNSKRMDMSFDVQRDHVKLIKLAMSILAQGGELIFSNNFRKFRLDEKALQDFEIEDISSRTIPEDFARRSNIHRCWRIRHAKRAG
jgi:23S rRNA (guanine2445-N2)-methyltransferase / 23S rRNA (guanine2069-N7)-methyltransferase